MVCSTNDPHTGIILFFIQKYINARKLHLTSDTFRLLSGLYTSCMCHDTHCHECQGNFGIKMGILISILCKSIGYFFQNCSGFLVLFNFCLSCYGFYFICPLLFWKLLTSLLGLYFLILFQSLLIISIYAGLLQLSLVIL